MITKTVSKNFIGLSDGPSLNCHQLMIRATHDMQSMWNIRRSSYKPKKCYIKEQIYIYINYFVSNTEFVVCQILSYCKKKYNKSIN